MSVTSNDTPKRQTLPNQARQAGAMTEAAFWAQLEDREEGRVAIEADHFFDTGYAWAG
jgi:hypothetical protein